MGRRVGSGAREGFNLRVVQLPSPFFCFNNVNKVHFSFSIRISFRVKYTINAKYRKGNEMKCL